MKKKKIVVMRSCIASLSCLYLMICSSCGNPRNGESKNEDNTKVDNAVQTSSKSFTAVDLNNLYIIVQMIQ